MTDVTNRNRVTKGVATGGQFAQEQHAEAAGGTTALTAPSQETRAVPATRKEQLDLRIAQTEKYLAELETTRIREDLAGMVREMPEDATVINVISWEEEAADDGSYDITLGDAEDADGGYVGNCSDYTIRIDPNSRTSPNDWAKPFLVEDEDGHGEATQLDVAKIREWGAENSLRALDDPLPPSAPFFNHDDHNFLEYVPPLPAGAPADTQIQVDSSGNEHTVFLWSGAGEKIASYRYADSNNEWTDNTEEFEHGAESGCATPEWADGHEDEILQTLHQVAKNADFASDRAQSRLRFAPGFRESVNELAIAGNPNMEAAWKAECGY